MMAIRLICLFVGCCVSIAAHADDTIDFSELMTPTCEMSGIVAIPAEGWFNVPFQDPPPGHLGCQMMLTDEGEALVGIIRIRSLTPEAPEYDPNEYDRLLANEVVAVGQMGYQLDEDPLWVRREVPVSGAGFTDGRAIGFQARIEGNEVAQEIHFLVFRGERAQYLVSLMTPAESYDGELYRRNLESFGQVIRTLQPRAGSKDQPPAP